MPVHRLGKGSDYVTRVNIEAERGRLQMSKTEMCQTLGVTLKTYNRYIRGTTIPSDVLEQLRTLTGCSIDYLLGLSPQPRERAG